MKKPSILITGGAGFIGSHLVDTCIKWGHEVTVIDDLSGGYTSNLHPDCTFYNLDLRDQVSTAEIIKKIKPNIVYHLAANAAENKAQYAPIDIATRNFNTFLNVIVPAINNGMKRIVVTSSIAVYGAIQTPFKESDRPHPEDIYGITKLAMEDCLKVLADVHDFEYVITRPHNVYGPRQNMSDPYRNVVTIFMNALLKGEAYAVYGNGKQKRCFSYVTDVVEGLYNSGISPEAARRTFNIGSDQAYTINELSSAIQEVTQTKIQPTYLEARLLDVDTAIADHTLARQLLGYKEKTSLTEGLRATWEYAQKLGYQEPVYGGIEIDSKKMPVNWTPLS